MGEALATSGTTRSTPEDVPGASHLSTDERARTGSGTGAAANVRASIVTFLLPTDSTGELMFIDGGIGVTLKNAISVEQDEFLEVPAWVPGNLERVVVELPKGRQPRL